VKGPKAEPQAAKLASELLGYLTCSSFLIYMVRLWKTWAKSSQRLLLGLCGNASKFVFGI